MAEAEFSAPCREDFFPAQTLLGDYRIDGFTASGSTGELYAATDLKTNQSCSIYVISSAISGYSPEVAARLLNRAQEACFFSHKNFVSIKSVFTFSEYRCIVMEPLKGRTLRSWIEKGGALPLTAEKIASELALLLGAEEKFPKLLCDFTPDDVFITTSGQVKLLYPGMGNQLSLLSGTLLSRDFRLSRNALFSAPEFLLGQKKDPFALAVYSLGALWAYMRGEGPFVEPGNLYVTFARFLTEEKVSSALPLVSRLTAKDPESRISAFRELQKRSKGKGFIRKAAFAGAAVLLLLCCGAAFLLVKYSSERAKQEQLWELQSYEVRKKERSSTSVSAPAPAPAPASGPRRESVKRKALPPHSVPQTEKKRVLPLPYPRIRTLENLIAYSRARLAQLESEPDSSAPGLAELRRRRIDFRKRQINALIARQTLEEKRSRISSQWAGSADEKDLRREVEGYLSSCKSDGDFIRRKKLIARGAAQPFPVDKLKNSRIDFGMPFNFPGIPSAARLPGTDRKLGATTLALLLLNGYLIPESQGTELLYDAQAPLGDIPLEFQSRFLTDKKRSESFRRYVIHELMFRKYSINLLMIVRYFKDRVAPDVVEEMVLMGAYVNRHSLLLHTAAADGNTSQAALFLWADASVEYADRNGRTPLFYASWHGRQECVKLLLESGADPEHKDVFGKRASDYEVMGAFNTALRQNDIPGVRRALEKGADVNAVLENDEPALVRACRSGNTAMVRVLLEAGADVNKKSFWNSTPLEEVFIASQNQRPEIFALLFEKGARSDRVTLSRLCRQFKMHRLAHLYAETMLKSGSVSVTAADIDLVCRAGSPALFKVLVKYASDLSSGDHAGLLRLAVETRQPADVIRLLLERKVPLPQPSELERLSRMTSDRAVRELLSRERDSGTVSQTGRGEPERRSVPRVTPEKTVQVRFPPDRQSFGPVLRDAKMRERVLKALKRERRKTLEELLKKGLDPNSVADGKTLLQLAVQEDNRELVQLLLKKGADPRCVSFACQTVPVILAVQTGKTRAFSVLIQERPLPQQLYVRLFDEIVKQRSSEGLLNEFLRVHKREIAAHPVSFLKLAAQRDCPERVVTRLMEIYGDLSAQKHQGAIHFALANRFSNSLLNSLLRRRIPVSGVEVVSVNVKGHNKIIRGTAVEIAELVKTSPGVVSLLRKGKNQ